MIVNDSVKAHDAQMSAEEALWPSALTLFSVISGRMPQMGMAIFEILHTS